MNKNILINLALYKKYIIYGSSRNTFYIVKCPTCNHIRSTICNCKIINVGYLKSLYKCCICTLTYGFKDNYIVLDNIWYLSELRSQHEIEDYS